MTRTRIAPSPTGYPHIGTIYQALFDYAFAKKNNGQFLVRIEDTDQSRLVADAEEKIFAALDWFGLSEDESPRKDGGKGPYRQSERLKLYKEHAEQLVEKEHAYYCFCTKERLDEVRKQMQAEGKPPMYDKHCRKLSKEEVEAKIKEGLSHVIRMKIPENTKIPVNDQIRGVIEFDSNTIDDQVIMKGDGFPTYHLAVVVDDNLMEITHVVRGEEWLSSFPKHKLLYDYFGFKIPLFFHTAVLRNPDKSKLSKRHGHTSVTWYQENGFLPEAILNFLSLMGWSHPEEKEIFPINEFIQLFELKDMKAIGPIFDLKKLEWMNGMYIRNMKPEVLTKRLLSFYDGQFSEELIQKTVPLIQERIKTLAEYKDYVSFFVNKPTQYEVDITEYKGVLPKIAEKLDNLEAWNAENIGEAMMSLANELGIKPAKYFQMLRVAVTGKKVSPPLNESMEILGKEECINRIKSSI